MRIIAGKYKNTKINPLPGANYRPSTNKFKEGLFSVLASGVFMQRPAFYEADILDLCTGSGSLAFEALSRGAKSVTCLDQEIKYLQQIDSFAASLALSEQVQTLQADIRYLPKTNRQYDLIFIDPPYFDNLIDKVLQSLLVNNYLKKTTIIAIEIAKNSVIKIDLPYKLIKSKIYGNSKLIILQYE